MAAQGDARRAASRMALVAAIAWGAIATACVGPFAPADSRTGGSAAGGTPSAQVASIAAGAPITVTAATPHLAPTSVGESLTPVAAYGSDLLLARTAATSGTAPAAGALSPSSYQLWDPASGVVSPVAGIDAPPGETERVLGSWQDWVLVARSAGVQTASGSLLLLNLKTGETREITDDADTARGGSSQISADGQVAWVANTPGSGSLHVYDIASGANASVPSRYAVSRRFSLEAGHLASLGGGSGQVVVRDLASRSSQTVSVGSVLSLALSSDGRFLIWIERSSNDASRLLVRDLTSGVTVQVLSGAAVGFGLSVSGQYVSWQPRPGASTAVAGVYNLQTRELRLLQPGASAVPYLAAVMGGSFVWTQGSGQAPVGGGIARAAGNAGASVYLVKLAP